MRLFICMLALTLSIVACRSVGDLAPSEPSSSDEIAAVSPSSSGSVSEAITLTAISETTPTLTSTSASTDASALTTSSPATPLCGETKLERDLLEINVLIAGRDTDASELQEKCNWLTNLYSGYPALAESILLLVDGRRFKQEMHLDTINGRFEEIAEQPIRDFLSADDIDPAELEDAILEHWKERYPTNIAYSIEEIVESE